MGVPVADHLIVSFVNKLDRDIRDPIELMDEVENVLKIEATPVTWPIGMGPHFKGIHHLRTDTIHVYVRGRGDQIPDDVKINALDSEEARELLGSEWQDFADQVEPVCEATPQFEVERFLAGELTPVFFGTAMGNFGVLQMLDDFIEYAPKPVFRDIGRELLTQLKRNSQVLYLRYKQIWIRNTATASPSCAFALVPTRRCMKVRHTRIGKDVRISDAVTFLAGDRASAEEAYPEISWVFITTARSRSGILLPKVRICNSRDSALCSQLFRRVRPKDPLKAKQPKKG